MTQKPTRRHATHDEHHAVHEEAHHFLEDHTAQGSDPTPEAALALVKKLGLRSDEVAALLGAKVATPEELQQAAKVNVAAIARAFPAEVTEALAKNPWVALGEGATVAAVREAADHARLAASAGAKLRLGAGQVEQSARKSADVLDGVSRRIVPQIEARAAADPSFGGDLSPVTAYHHVRYPGGPGRPAAATKEGK
jgi:hypothetical protein